STAMTGALTPDAEPRNFDARIAHNADFQAPVPGRQSRALAALRSRIPELAATFDPTSGVTRSLYNRNGYLTAPAEGPADPMATALGFVRAHLPALGLTTADVADLRVQDSLFTRVTGAARLYLIQEYRGLPVYNAQLHVNVNRDGRILSVNNGLVSNLAASAGPSRARLSAAEAVMAATRHLGLELRRPPEVLRQLADPERTTYLAVRELSRDEIVVGLAWLPIRSGDTRLVWSFQIPTAGAQHYYDFTVDAGSGRVWTRFDWVAATEPQYTVYPQPVESPQHTTPLPPADARVTVLDPADLTASPLRWHATGSSAFSITRGNNVHAYEDRDGNNAPPAGEVGCGDALHCNFPLDLSQNPSTHIPASVTNLFYWNNVIHDVQYQYGFDEAGGNFQVNNFGLGGAGGDDVRAEAQDNVAFGNCNANFLTLPDGSRPRMQMFLCTNTSPPRDGDFDDGVIVHEYGHGISNRQVGGPSNVSCLNNNQQPGEGWSDWLALAYTAEVGDQGTDQRGTGSYLFGLPPNGTIRPQPYSTDPGINNYTYESINGLSVPHGVGSVWAQAIWEVYWALVEAHGFDPDLTNAFGGAGNQRAMLYVNEGLKNTACSPTFVDTRDGVIQAATDNFGGEDVCTLWDAFAAFGLGTNADPCGPNCNAPTNGFAVPGSCSGPGGGNFQFGVETIDEQTRTVTLSGFIDPIVVLGPPSFIGTQPTTTRVINVTSSSFQHFLQEWDYLDGAHLDESIGYLVLESGTSDLGGLAAEAGSVNINQEWASVNFSQAFTGAPVVMAQVASFAGDQAVTTRIRNVTASGFEVRLQEEEGNDGEHAVETVHYIAIEPGTATIGGTQLVVDRTADQVTHNFFTINFGTSVASPAFLADMQTTDGGDPATLRHTNLTSTSAQVKVEEEQSANSETAHTTEVVGWVVLGPS
ncbi:MAG: M36 family metallopeptidase, partial [Thermoanaerobaculia bacterium]